MELKKGFSLIEILVAVTVIAVLASLTLSAFKNTDNSKSLEVSAETIQSTIDEAKSRAILGTDDDSHGVHFSTTSITMFSGSTYNPLDSTNEKFGLNKNTEITEISLNGGGSDIIFNKLTGETSKYGSITINLLNSTTASTTVSVSESGFVDIE